MPLATVGRRLNFDGSEAVTCVLHEGNRRGVQLVSEGFNIEDADVTMVSAMGAETLVPPPADKTGIKHALIGKEGFAFKGVIIEGLTPGGDYALTIIE